MYVSCNLEISEHCYNDFHKQYILWLSMYQDVLISKYVVKKWVVEKMSRLVHYECPEVPEKKTLGCKLEISYVRRSDFCLGKFAVLLTGLGGLGLLILLKGMSFLNVEGPMRLFKLFCMISFI